MGGLGAFLSISAFEGAKGEEDNEVCICGAEQHVMLGQDHTLGAVV